MSDEIKLGWYQSRINPEQYLEVVYSCGEKRVIKIANQLSIWDERLLRDCYDYIGTELGEWVSPDEVKLSELPIKARFRDRDSDSWNESELHGYNALERSCFIGGVRWRQCQVWREKK